MADLPLTAEIERDAFLSALSGALRQINLSLSEASCDALLAHYRAVVETNRVMNLTRLTSPTDAAVKHYADSLALVAWADHGGLADLSILDVGTGAGFPAIPVAIGRPGWKVTAVDATGKKIDFVRRVAEQLGLANLRAEHLRVERSRPAQRFDVVVARAVTKLDPLLRWMAPYARAGGLVVAFKSRPDAEELAAGERLARNLRLTTLPDWSYPLTCEGESLERVLKVFRRTA